MDTTTASPKIDSEAVEPTKPKKATGRPVSRPECAQATFHLPVDLLKRVEVGAAKISGRNKSSFVEKALEMLLSSIEE